MLARQKALTGKGIEPYDYAFAIESEPIANWQARYGVTWDDITTPQDRQYGIAGGSLKVVDLQTNEVIAERTGFIHGWRECPAFTAAQTSGPFSSGHAPDFIVQVLKPAR